jgi:HEAT repeat protein
LLGHEAQEVRVAALNYLQQASTLPRMEEIAPLLADSSPAVRASAVMAFCAVAREKAISAVVGVLQDPEPGVRAAAAAGLIRYGGLDGMLAAADDLKSMLQSAQAADRGWAAWILGEIGVQHFYQPLVPLLADADLGVQQRAIEAAGSLKNPALVEALLNQLVQPRLATPIAEALAAHGETVEPRLLEVLADGARPTVVRMQVCRVLARLGTQNAADALLQHVEAREPNLRAAVVQGLSALLHRRPGVQINMQAITGAIRASARQYLSLVVLSADLQLDQQSVLLGDALAHRQRQAINQLFALLALKYPVETVDLVNRNLQSPQANVRANAIEVLDNLLDKDDKVVTLPLLEDGSDARKLSLAQELFALARRDREQRLLEILHGADAWLSVCAAMAIAQWGLRRFTAEVRTLLKSDQALLRETALVALGKLGGGALTRDAIEPLVDDGAPAVSRYARHVLKAMS